MDDPRGTRLDLAELLAAVENASPVAVADVVGEHLAAAVGASEVAFLIADFSGRARWCGSDTRPEKRRRAARGVKPLSECRCPGERTDVRSPASRSRSRKARMEPA